MFGLKLSYILTLFLLTPFGGAFFSVDLYLPNSTLKSLIHFHQSKIYLDETIDNAGGLLDEEFAVVASHTCSIPKTRKLFTIMSAYSSAPIPQGPPSLVRCTARTFRIWTNTPNFCKKASSLSKTTNFLFKIERLQAKFRTAK